MGMVGLRLRHLREPFESQIVRRYLRTTAEVQALLPELYLHGLAPRDFQEALEVLLGNEAPLSQTSIVRAKSQWEREYQRWKRRSLDSDYLYVWIDGVYSKAGPKDERIAVLTVVGLNRKGQKEVLAIVEGYRESFESWRDVFRDLKKRGLRWIGLLISDGLAGLAKAVREIYPMAKRQQCFVHKMMNVLDKVPDNVHEDVLRALREMYHAKSKEQPVLLHRAFSDRYRNLYPQVVRTLEEAGDYLFSFFDFPKRHWKSIKSPNLFESLFNAVKLRTDGARRILSRQSASSWFSNCYNAKNTIYIKSHLTYLFLKLSTS